MVQEVLIIITALMLGGALKGATGMGVPLIAVPALAAFFDVPFAIAILMGPLLVTNMWQVWTFRSHRTGLAFLPRLVVFAGFGIVVGTWVLTSLPADALSLGLGLTTTLYIVLRLARPTFAIDAAAAIRWAPAAGFGSGLLQGATGLSAPINLPFVNGMRLARPQFVFTVSVVFLAFVVTQIPALAYSGVLTGERALLSLGAIVPVAAGMPIGAWLARRMSAEAFDRLILIVLAVIAAKLFWDAAFGG